MPRVSSSRLIGRGAELAALASAYRHAEGGELSLVLLGGEAGIGKTRLVAEHVATVREAGGRILIGECVQVGDTSLPYGPFLDALGSNAVPGALPGAAPISWSPAGGPADMTQPSARDTRDRLGAQAALFAAVAADLDRLAREQPVLLVLEDLHWADPASRDLLVYLVRRLRERPVQVIATFRTDALHRRHPLMRFLAEARRWPFVERVELTRLDLPAVVELIGEIVGAPPSRATIEHVYARSEGVPFYVESLVDDDARASTDGGTVAWEILGPRLAALSPGALRVVGAAAVLGRRIAHDLLLQVVRDAPDVVMAALRELAEAHLVVPSRHDPGAYEFRHALIQEVAYDELLPTERSALHRRVATLLAAGADLAEETPMALAGEIAHHAERAHDLPLALAAADAAGRAATGALAFTDADRHFAMALELWAQVHGDVASPDLAALVGRAALAAGYANQPARAARYDRRALELAASDEERAAILHELFWHLWEAGETDDRVATAERALDLLAGRQRTVARAIALADLGFARWSACENDAAEVLAREAVGVAHALGDERLEGNGLFVLGLAVAEQGRTRAADAIFATAADHLAAGRDADGAARVAHWWSNMLEFDGRFARGLEVAEAGLAAATAAGVDVRHGDSLRAVIAENLEHLGRWDEALAVAADGFNWGSDQPSEIWSHAVHARIGVCRGELDGARQHLDAAGRVQAAGPDRIWQAEELMGLAYALGEVGQARARLADGIAATPTPENQTALWWMLIRALDAEVEIAVRARAQGDAAVAAEAERHAGRCAELVEANVASAVARGGEGALIHALAAWSKALRARLEGRPDPAAWRSAVDRLDATGTAWYTAQARCRFAEALVLAGAPREEVADALRAARATALHLATPPLVEEVERLARAAAIGLDGATAAPGDAAGVEGAAGAIRDPYGLSPRELEVLALVADGRTNREIGDALFISPKTASVHVTHILEKMGVASRVEAALLAARAHARSADAAAPAGTRDGGRR